MLGETPRHLTALKRTDLSRPVASAVRDGLLDESYSFFDYGCGRGDDLRRLSSLGFNCTGWDPVHSPDGQKRKSDVVNLGYVVNVIENIRERVDTLKDAWSYADRLLVVSARLVNELNRSSCQAAGDGFVTSRGTFQKFYEQSELRDWIDATLHAESIPAAPGIFYVFRSREDRESFFASRYRSRTAAPQVRRSDAIFDEHREILEPFATFLNDRGRFPDAFELPELALIEERVGSLRRAFRVIERVTGVEEWEQVRDVRSSELLIYLALVCFSSRPKLSELPPALRLDVKAFFGSYKRACSEADQLLFAAGNPVLVEAACKLSPIGKSAGAALYVHQSAIDRLPAVLRVYEGCARAYIGMIEEANIIKLHRDNPKISYLSYPGFDREPHPALASSLSIHLQTFRMREIDYQRRENPPVLHRKDAFVSEDYPHRDKFARLTLQEERFGLFDEPLRIGTRRGWEEKLADSGVRLRGHRVIRRAVEPAVSDQPPTVQV